MPATFAFGNWRIGTAACPTSSLVAVHEREEAQYLPVVRAYDDTLRRLKNQDYGTATPAEARHAWTIATITTTLNGTDPTRLGPRVMAHHNWNLHDALPAAPTHDPARTVEVLGPTGIVHYRRPADHPLVAQIREAPHGYTIREVPG